MDTKIDSYKASYAWVAIKGSFDPKEKIEDNQIFCAWCNKSKEEIKKSEDPDEHIDNHVKKC